MKHTLKVLVLLIAGLILLTGTAAADAVPAYEIDVSNLKDDGTNYYIMAGTNLTIPVNLTYESDDAIGYMIIITNITQNEQQITSGLTYKYTLSSAVNADLAGAVNGKEYNYQFTGSETEMKGILPSFVTIEVSGLTAGEQYDVQLEIYAGNTTHDFDKSVAALAKPVTVYSLYQGATEINIPAWNLSTPLTVTTTLITAGNVPAGTYVVPWETYELKRGNDNFSLLIDTTNTSTSVLNVLKRVSGVWEKASASSVSLAGETLSLTIGEADASAEEYCIQFTGYNLGDVTDRTNGPDSSVINIIDINLILTASVSTSPESTIDISRLIYADCVEDGIIDIYDATALFWYILTDGAIDGTLHATA